MMKTTHRLIWIVLFLQVNWLSAQNTAFVLFEPQGWEIEAEKHEFLTYKGKPALYLENGMAIHKRAELQDGIIEFDMCFENARRFMGVQFRRVDKGNYEEFYVRPHQSGNPDATQYTPVFNGNAAWQLYHGEGHSNAYAYNFGEWIHVKLLISGNQMDVFINDMSQPLIYVHELKRETVSGGMSFSSFMGGGYFANLSYTPMEAPKLFSEEKKYEAGKGVITQWEVSPTFSSKKLAGLTSLKDFEEFDEINWEVAETEYTGTLNLSRFSEVTDATNTIWVKTEIEADKAGVQQVDIGYSDQIFAFVNRQLVYSGQNIFRSRDYRYLGTIGFFDSIYVPLKKGKNTVYFAVAENFGGWGIKARLTEMNK